MGTKFTTKFWYVQSEDGVKRPILHFKEDQGDRYEQYDRVLSTDFLFQLTLIYFYSISVNLWST